MDLGVDPVIAQRKGQEECLSRNHCTSEVDGFLGLPVPLLQALFGDHASINSGGAA
jgi:hypothetical protein